MSQGKPWTWGSLMSEELELAYFAGFFDGEGCIGLYWITSKKGYQPQTQLGNTNKPILKAFQARFGGIVRSCKVKPFQRPTWQWSINGGGAKIAYFLKAILPYLRQKKEEAETMLEYIDTITTTTKPIPPELQEIRKKLSERLKELKRV